MIMEVMKPQIAAGSRGVSVAYGEILFRVWKDFSVDRKGDETVSIEVIECSAIRVATSLCDLLLT